MNPIKLTDCQVLSPSLNGRQELSLRIKIKKIDYELTDYTMLCETSEKFHFVAVFTSMEDGDCRFSFTDCQILSVSLNGRQELLIKTKVAKGNYTIEQYKKLCEICDTTQFNVVLQGFDEEVVDHKPKLIQTLVMTVKEYCSE